MQPLRNSFLAGICITLASCGSANKTADTSSSGAAELLVGAFNLHQFGPTKAGKSDVLKAIAGIIKRYDVIFLQEIRDSTGEAVNSLMTEVGGDYQKLVSQSLGRSSSYKEQYAFLYKDSAVKAPDSLQFTDADDKFEREPFSFIIDNSGKKIALVGLHAKPEDVVSEMGALYSAVGQLKSKGAENNFVILGDLNADCSYLSDKERDALSIKADSSYSWLIASGTDTTTSKTTTCAYDQVITHGSVTASGAGVFNFDSNIGTVAPADVSDHYPVEFKLKLE